MGSGKSNLEPRPQKLAHSLLDVSCSPGGSGSFKLSADRSLSLQIRYLEVRGFSNRRHQIRGIPELCPPFFVDEKKVERVESWLAGSAGRVIPGFFSLLPVRTI